MIDVIHEDMIKYFKDNYNIEPLNVSIYGSYIEHLIGINIVPSDIDIEVVVPDDFDIIDSHIDLVNNEMDVEITVFHESDFVRLLSEEPKYLLASFSNTKYVELLSTLSLSTVRSMVSNVSSKAYNKGKKKLIMADDYDERLGLKNIWHSIKFAYMAKWFFHDHNHENGLNDVKKLNEIRIMLYNAYTNTGDLDESFGKLNDIMKPIFNNTMTEFRKMFPK